MFNESSHEYGKLVYKHIRAHLNVLVINNSLGDDPVAQDFTLCYVLGWHWSVYVNLGTCAVLKDP